MAISLTGVFGDLANLVPSQSDIVNQVAAGAAASVVLAGLKSQAGLDAVDPLHLIHPAAAPNTGTTSTVVGKSITSAAFNALAPAAQAQVLAAGYVIAG